MKFRSLEKNYILTLKFVPSNLMIYTRIYIKITTKNYYLKWLHIVDIFSRVGFWNAVLKSLLGLA